MNTARSSARTILDGFVVFEGIDGTGTTTQLEILARSLAARKIPSFATAEPTASELGKLIRRILKTEYTVSPETLAFLYAADRNEHLYGRNGIQDHLRSGELVICDRYLFSSLAYQGDSCGPDLPERLNQDFPLPSLLVFFDLAPDTALERISTRSTRDLFERREILYRVTEAYDSILKRFQSEGLRVIRVDGSLPIQAVSELIWNAVLPLIPAHEL